MTTQLISQPYHLPRDRGPALWHLGAVLTFKATSEQTGGRMWAKELLAPRDMATPVHRHSREDEAFYLLDGAPRWREWAGSSIRESTWFPRRPTRSAPSASSVASRSTPWRRSPSSSGHTAWLEIYIVSYPVDEH